MQDRTIFARRAGQLLAGTAALLISAPIFAQATPSPAPSGTTSEQNGLEEIVVTARKRVENAQNIPVAVTAVSGETLRRYDLNNLEKITLTTPDLAVSRSTTGAGAQITLRGIGSPPSSIGIEPSVALIIDGVYYGQGRTINEGLVDVDRIEVLKGPQALFFGKNATAGVISISTANPSSQPEYRATAGYEFSAEEVRGEIVASGPVSDTLGVRLAVSGAKQFGGWVTNTAGPINFSTLDVATGVRTAHVAPPTDRDQPGQQNYVARLTLNWAPTNRLTVNLKGSGNYFEAKSQAANKIVYSCVGGISQIDPGRQCDRDFISRGNNLPAEIAANFPYAGDGRLRNRYTSGSVTGTVTYDLEDVTLSSVTNYNQNAAKYFCDCDNQSNANSTYVGERNTWKAFSNESRVNTNFTGPINLLFGTYYQHTKRALNQYAFLANLEDSTVAPRFRYVGRWIQSRTTGDTLSAFGQVSWKVRPQLEATGGVRYVHETKDSFLSQPYVNAALRATFPAYDPNNPATFAVANQVFNDWSPEATLTYRPTDEITIYGAYKTAYKSGGFSNAGGLTRLPPALAFRPEKANGFEAGIKTTLMDRQLRFNVTAYTYQYKNLQVDFFNAPISAFITTNAGSARTKGLEATVEYAPHAVTGLTLTGALNYNRAGYKNFIGPCYTGETPADGCTLTFFGAPGQDISGKPTSVAPRWTGSAGFNYDTALGSGIKGGVAVDGRYSSSYIVSAFGNLATRQPAYVLLNAAMNIRTADDRWTLSLIGRNLTNRFIATAGVDGASTGSGTGTAAGRLANQVGFINQSRTVQLQLAWRY